MSGLAIVLELVHALSLRRLNQCAGSAEALRDGISVCGASQKAIGANVAAC